MQMLFAPLLLPFTGCLAFPDVKTKYMDGVPVYNIDKAYADAAIMDYGANKQEWIVVLKSSRSSDKDIHAMCMDTKNCIGGGHEGGVPFTGVKASEEELAQMVRKHKDKIEFIEPSTPIILEPPNPEEVALVAQGSGFLVIGINQQHKIVVWGPFKTRNEADNIFSQNIQRTPTLVITPVAQYKIERGQGHQNDSRLKQGWTCKTTGKDCHGVGPAPSPSPSPGGNPFPPGGPRPSPTPSSPSPPGAAPTNRWGLDRIDQRTGRDRSFTRPAGVDGKGVHVYVVDTGIRATHEDFGGRVIPTIDTSTKKVVVCSPEDVTCATDTNAHGTHVAGTVGGAKSGVATGATIHAVKVMNSRRDGSTLRNLLAIDWVAKNAIRPAVMSMSLGGDGFSPSMNYSVFMAYKAGILSVVAAGNIGNGQVKDGNACSQTPAHVMEAYVVAASSPSDARARYSNAGKCCDIWAPGDNILSTVHNNDQAYDTMSGTSMATPHVSGAVALMLQKFPTASPDQLAEALTRYATPDVISNPGAGTPNKMLYITEYTVKTTTTTTTPGAFPAPSPSKSRRRRRKAPGSTRRRKGSTRRRKGSTRRRKGSTRRRKR